MRCDRLATRKTARARPRAGHRDRRHGDDGRGRRVRGHAAGVQEASGESAQWTERETEPDQPLVRAASVDGGVAYHERIVKAVL